MFNPLPVIGAALGSTGITLEKIAFRNKKISPELILTALFIGLIIVMAPFIAFFFRIDTPAYLPLSLIIFAIVILLSVFHNISGFYALQGEKVSNLVSVQALSPLFIIIITILFSFISGQELFTREPGIVFPAIIAGTAILLSHYENKKVNFNKWYLLALASSVIAALELVTSQFILAYYSPLTFYFVRAGFVALLSLFIFRPGFGVLDKKAGLLVLLASACWVLYRVILYTGFTSIGIIQTTLLFMLGPTFTYLFAWLFLKEKIPMKQILATIVVIACIVYVTIF